MSLRKTLRQTGLILALAACLAALQGCATARKVGIYGSDRFNDAFDMVDLGVTLTLPWERPYFSVYGCAIILTAGYGCVDGYFTGIGGSRVCLFTRHYHWTLGLVAWSYEEFGWGDFDKNNRDTLAWRYVGLLGWLLFPKNRQFYGPA